MLIFILDCLDFEGIKEFGEMLNEKAEPNYYEYNLIGDNDKIFFSDDLNELWAPEDYYYMEQEYHINVLQQYDLQINPGIFEFNDQLIHYPYSLSFLAL